MVDPYTPYIALVVVMPTELGKSTVLRGAATLLGGVSLLIIPTQTLAVYQIASLREKGGVIYLDELKTTSKVKNAVGQLEKLVQLKPEKRPCVFVVTSPHCLTYHKL
jgi:superfamily II DNA helicase RecQ